MMNELTFSLCFYWDIIQTIGYFMVYLIIASAIAFGWMLLWNKSWTKRHKMSFWGSIVVSALLVTLLQMNHDTAACLLQKGGSYKLERKLIHPSRNQLEKILQDCPESSCADQKAKAQAIFTELCRSTLQQSKRYSNGVFPCQIKSPTVPNHLTDKLCELHAHRTYGNQLEALYEDCREELQASIAHAIAEAQIQQHESSLKMWANMDTRLFYGMITLCVLIILPIQAVNDIRIIHPIKA